jgi:hypothetical protein
MVIACREHEQRRRGVRQDEAKIPVAQVLRLMYDVNAAVTFAVLINDFPRRVGRAVVGDQQAEVVERLTEDRIDRAPEIVGALL